MVYQIPRRRARFDRYYERQMANPKVRSEVQKELASLYHALPEDVQDELQAIHKVLEQSPLLGLPRVDAQQFSVREQSLLVRRWFRNAAARQRVRMRT